MAKDFMHKAQEEILKGRSHQDLFNEIAKHTTFDIHDIGDAIRKIPTPAKRKKYRDLNYALVFLVAVLFLNCLINLIFYYVSFYDIVPVIILPLLGIGLLKFAPNMHIFTGVALLVGTVRQIYPIIVNFSFLTLLFLIIIAGTCTIAFYLGVKLPADYRMNKDQLKENPEQRVDSLIFTD